MSGQGLDLAAHQVGQGHFGAYHGGWNHQDATLRLPRMHELPPLNTQLIPASLAHAFDIKLADSDGEDHPQGNDGSQQGQPGQQRAQQSSEQHLQSQQQPSQQQQQQQQRMQQGLIPATGLGLEVQQERQASYGHQYAPYAPQGFTPMLVGMQASTGNVPQGYNSFSAAPSMYGFNPRDAMTAGYNIAPFQGFAQQPQLQPQQPQQQQQQGQTAQQQQQQQGQPWQHASMPDAAAAVPPPAPNQDQAPEEAAAAAAHPLHGAGAGEEGDDMQARALKRPRLVWTPKLHTRFVAAVEQLGLKHAVPKTIMQLMGVEGLTRENVASHLQKFRLQQKRDNRLDAEGNLLAPLPRPEAGGGGADSRAGAGEPGPHSAEEPDQGHGRGSSPEQPAASCFPPTGEKARPQGTDKTQSRAPKGGSSSIEAAPLVAPAVND